MHENLPEICSNMQIICNMQLHAENMQVYANNMKEICSKYANVLNVVDYYAKIFSENMMKYAIYMQNMQKSTFCIFCIICTPYCADDNPAKYLGITRARALLVAVGLQTLKQKQKLRCVFFLISVVVQTAQNRF